MTARELRDELKKASPHKPLFIYDPCTAQFYRVGEIIEGSFFAAVSLGDHIPPKEFEAFLSEHLDQQKHLSHFKERRSDDHRDSSWERPSV